MSGHRTGGGASPSPSRRRTRPSPTRALHCPTRACARPLVAPAGHAHWPSPLRRVPGGAPGLHPHPLPTEYEQQPPPVPSMEKKRTVYQMALSKMAQPGSLGCPGPLAPRSPGCGSHSNPLPACAPLGHLRAELITSRPNLAPAIKYERPLP